MEAMLAPYKTLYRAVDGRAGRNEFWMFFLLFVGLHIVPFVLLVMMAGGASALESSNLEGLMDGVGALVLLLFIPLYAVLILSYLACMAVSIRRLHDVGITGWVYVALSVSLFIPLLNFLAMIAYLVLMALPGAQGGNKYGPPPGSQDPETVFG